MTATPTLPHGYVLLTGTPRGVSRGWIFSASLAQTGLLVPQITGLLHWASKEGKLPFSPALYVGVMVVLNLLLLLQRRPVFSHTGLAILGLCLLRLLDVICQRFGTPEIFASVATRLSLTCIFAFLSLLISSVTTRLSIIPICTAAITSILVSTGANLAEMAGYLKNSSVPGRAAGFIPDANDSAIAIICMLALLLTLQRYFWLNVALIAVSFAGVFPTLSRSGFLVLALILLVFFALNFREHAGKILLSAGLFIGLGIVATALLGMSNTARNDTNVQERLGAIFGGDTKKMESTERMKDLSDGLDGAMQKPLLGHGTGAGTVYWKPHNQIVSLWIDIGLPGAILYIAILLVLLWKACTQPAAALLGALPVIAFFPFSQTLVDTAAYWLIAMIAALRSSSRPLSIQLFHSASPTTHFTYGLAS